MMVKITGHLLADEVLDHHDQHFDVDNSIELELWEKVGR